VGPGVPVSVCPAVASALALAFPVIVLFALDVVARLAVFWGHPPVSEGDWRFPAFAFAERSDDPAPASPEADPALADASGPTHYSQRAVQPAQGSRSDELPEVGPSDWIEVVAKRCLDQQDDPPGGHLEIWETVGCSAPPAFLHSDWHHSAALVGQGDGLEVTEGYSL
jgi:hypothetical protein